MSNDKEVPKRLRLVLCEFNKSSQVGGNDNWGVTMAMIDADYEKSTTVGFWNTASTDVSWYF